MVCCRRSHDQSSAYSGEVRCRAVRPLGHGFAGASLWRANASTSAPGSESTWTESSSRAECRGLWPVKRGAHICAGFRGWHFDEFKFGEEVWLCRTGAPWNARRTADEGIDGVSRSFKPIHDPPDYPAVVVRSRREYSLLARCSGSSGLSG